MEIQLPTLYYNNTPGYVTNPNASYGAYDGINQTPVYYTNPLQQYNQHVPLSAYNSKRACLYNPLIDTEYDLDDECKSNSGKTPIRVTVTKKIKYPKTAKCKKKRSTSCNNCQRSCIPYACIYPTNPCTYSVQPMPNTAAPPSYGYQQPFSNLAEYHSGQFPLPPQTAPTQQYYSTNHPAIHHTTPTQPFLQYPSMQSLQRIKHQPDPSIQPHYQQQKNETFNNHLQSQLSNIIPQMQEANDLNIDDDRSQHTSSYALDRKTPLLQTSSYSIDKFPRRARSITEPRQWLRTQRSHSPGYIHYADRNHSNSGIDEPTAKHYESKPKYSFNKYERPPFRKYFSDSYHVVPTMHPPLPRRRTPPLPNHEEMKELENEFNILSRGKTFIDKDTFVSLINTMLGAGSSNRRNNSSMLTRIFNKMDYKHDGVIDYEEFTEAYRQLSSQNEIYERIDRGKTVSPLNHVHNEMTHKTYSSDINNEHHHNHKNHTSGHYRSSLTNQRQYITSETL
ncbi:hypothetical protein GJ496_011531 [Pomphorhynchus laevis]|nr:hypothetical protein GJ496_011531 [Pomphorhynchus laevis]